MSEPAFPGRLSREDPDLSERQRQVFAALLTLHGRSARPIGSETLAQLAGIPLSPASIRNALAELESLGLLERHHSSAGRVPSVRGYELYVRAILTPEALPPEVMEEVGGRLLRSTRDVEHLLSEASRLLSALTHQFGLAVATSLDQEVLSRLDLAPLGERKALMVFDLGGGAVHTLVLELESPLERQELEEVAGVLRERLLGRPMAEVRARLGSDPELVRKSAVRLVVLAASESWSRSVSTPRFSAGAMHMAEQPVKARGQEAPGSAGREEVLSSESESSGEPGIAPERAAGAESAFAAGEVPVSAEGLRDRWLRAEAELQNFRRRAQRDLEEARRFTEERVLLEMISMLDDLERGLESAREAGAPDPWVQGVQLVAQHMGDYLAGLGITPTHPLGERFDPEFHEALLAVEAPPGTEPGEIVQVVRKGYRRNGRALRAARVVVARRPGGEGH